MSSPKFGPGDKIFAKVRGYPPWPARVEGVADETPNKMKYHVYFYGTGETAVCKQEELFPYVENREKYGKPMKKKGFNEALIQIDSELGFTPSVLTPQTPGPEEAEFEGSFVSDDGVGKKTKSNTSTPVTSKPKEQKSGTLKRKSDNIESDNSSKKPAKKSLGDQSSDTTPKSVPSELPVTSRSGRKIKPKKVEELVDSSEMKVKSIKSPKLKDSFEGKNMEVDAELIDNGILVAFTPKGEQIRIKIDTTKNKPLAFKSEKARLEWEAKFIEDGQKLKAQIESGKLLPEDVQKEIDDKYKDRLIQIEQKMAVDDKNEKLEYLRIEAQLLDIDIRIKNSLSLKQADPEACLNLMDELLVLKLNPLMLKKHPEVVDTIKKLRRYVGNTSTWKMTDQEVVKFSNKAASIRSKAEHAYNKMKSLFMIPYGKSFWDIFAQELKEFNERTKNFDSDELCGLTSDPTEDSSKTGPEESKTVEPVNSSEP